MFFGLFFFFLKVFQERFGRKKLSLLLDGSITLYLCASQLQQPKQWKKNKTKCRIKVCREKRSTQTF